MQLLCCAHLDSLSAQPHHFAARCLQALQTSPISIAFYSSDSTFRNYKVRLGLGHLIQPTCLPVCATGLLIQKQSCGNL